jgi:hypothetical protein
MQDSVRKGNDLGKEDLGLTRNNTRAYTLGFSLYPTRPDTDILSQLKLELNTDNNGRSLIVVEVIKTRLMNECVQGITD